MRFHLLYDLIIIGYYSEVNMMNQRSLNCVINIKNNTIFSLVFFINIAVIAIYDNSQVIKVDFNKLIYPYRYETMAVLRSRENDVFTII